MNPTQFRDFIVRPITKHVRLWSPSAENLLMGTALHESANLHYIDQTTPGPGPAFGLFQMEAPTHDTVWRWMRRSRPLLVPKVEELLADYPNRLHQLWSNLNYQTIIARINYLRIKEPLPAADDIEGLANYWKKYWNTPKGKGKPEQFVKAFNKWKG